MRLEARRFMEEFIDGMYRAHFVIEYQETKDGALNEVARFGVEAEEKPTEEEMRVIVRNKLKDIKIVKTVEEKKFRVGVDVS